MDGFLLLRIVVYVILAFFGNVVSIAKYEKILNADNLHLHLMS